MCIIFFYVNSDPDNKYKFILASNREEAGNRQTIKLGPFEQDQNIYAGRDIKGQGTWLGINIKTKIITFLTNIYTLEQRSGKSRGELTYYFLKTSNFINVQNKDQKINLKLEQIKKNSSLYPLFNLVVYNIETNKTFYINNKQQIDVIQKLNTNQIHIITSAIRSIKVEKAKYGQILFQSIIKKKLDSYQMIKQLQLMLHNQEEKPDSRIRQNCIFIKPYFQPLLGKERKTRSSGIILIQNSGKLIFKQLTYQKQLISKTLEIQL